MRYDDPTRPQHAGALSIPLHVAGCALPSVELIRPMASESSVWWECNAGEGCKQAASEECLACVRHSEPVWGWLCAIHAERERGSFRCYTGFIVSLAEFERAYLLDPERALARWFKYEGPEAARSAPQSPRVEEDIFT